MKTNTEKKVVEMTTKEAYDLIVKEVAKIPQVRLKKKRYTTDEAGYFMRIAQGGQIRLWFILVPATNKPSELSFIIAIQDPEDNWTINDHYLIDLNYVSDMIELIKVMLGLEGRI